MTAAHADVEDVTLVQHETSRGRPRRPMRVCARRRTRSSRFSMTTISFIRQHLARWQCGALRARGVVHRPVSAFLRPNERAATKRIRACGLYAQDYDRALLLLDNYIRCRRLLLQRDLFSTWAASIRPSICFEDWDS